MDPTRTQMAAYAALFETNDFPSDIQRVEITTALRELEAEYESLFDDDHESFPVGPDELDWYQVPYRIRKVRAAIYRHRGLLSCIRGIPREIWQKVYAIVLLEIGSGVEVWNLSRHRALQTFCSVSRLWRDAATTHKSFWTLFPPTMVRGDAGQIPRPECLDLYLERSEPLPFSFLYASRGYFLQATHRILPKPDTPMDPFPQNLLRASARWSGISLRLLLPEIQDLLCIQDHTPDLKAVKLVFAISEGVQETMPQINRLFSTAPSLRNFAVETACIPPDVETPVFDLPWSQMESFSSTSREDLYLYPLVRHQVALTSLHIDSCDFPLRNGIQPGQGYYTLSQLKCLSLRITMGTGYMYLFAGILMKLRAPALEELRLLGEGENQNEVITWAQATLATLLAASMSTLKRLSLDGGLGSPLSGSSIMHFLFHLEQLDIGMPGLDDVKHYREMLSARAKVPPGPNAPQLPGPISTTLPRLNILKLRTTCSCIEHLAKLPSTTTQQDVIPNAESQWATAMEELVASRTYAIPTAIETIVVPLREIHFIDCNEPSYSGSSNAIWLTRLYAFYGALELRRLPIGVIPISPNVVEELRNGLTKMWLWSEASMAKEGLNGMVQEKAMDTLIRKMEELDLSTLDSRPLAMRGIFFFLGDLAEHAQGTILQDGIYNLQERVINLYNKWTPFLSRDMQWSPFRWCYVDQYHLRLKYAGLGGS
ncbi:hypothetical protein DFP72DRAFT_931502 [Ephemerocybe angulata]|uniref:F-box domain-containing protein n=1 Tax=Ephemerocybe angulata TaxID=980116 RepID=A0A8H6HCR6_9AGAR|nr:hypothetical protein DFP72DRAFT_931502 [Tulosesus angulatus]